MVNWDREQLYEIMQYAKRTMRCVTNRRADEWSESYLTIIKQVGRKGLGTVVLKIKKGKS